MPQFDLYLPKSARFGHLNHDTDPCNTRAICPRDLINLATSCSTSPVLSLYKDGSHHLHAALNLIIAHQSHRFAHQFMLICIFSLTNSLTNSCSYHIRSQISHLTVLKFAHQFANILNCSLDCNTRSKELRQQTNLASADARPSN